MLSDRSVNVNRDGGGSSRQSALAEFHAAQRQRPRLPHAHTHARTYAPTGRARAHTHTLLNANPQDCIPAKRFRERALTITGAPQQLPRGRCAFSLSHTHTQFPLVLFCARSSLSPRRTPTRPPLPALAHPLGASPSAAEGVSRDRWEAEIGSIGLLSPAAVLTPASYLDGSGKMYPLPEDAPTLSTLRQVCTAPRPAFVNPRRYCTNAFPGSDQTLLSELCTSTSALSTQTLLWKATERRQTEAFWQRPLSRARRT
jgi:hypothetical protein